jgi:DNA-binding CsgD family transcriptional regulator
VSTLTALAGEIEGLSDGHDVATRVAALSRRCFELQAALVTRLGVHADLGSAPEPWSDPLQALSPRERAVVDLVTGPHGDPGNAAIAATLGIGTATVKTHMGSVLAKLGLEHRSELRWLVRCGQDDRAPTGSHG